MVAIVIILSVLVILLLGWVFILSKTITTLDRGMRILNNNQVIFQGDIQKIAQIIEHNAKVVNEIINIKNKVIMPFGPIGKA